MRAHISIEADIDEPIDAAGEAVILAVAQLRAAGIRRVEFNGDGDAMLTTVTGRPLGINVERIPRVPGLPLIRRVR
jgi:hypothetical protein